jgi:hypothetical protein
MTTDFTPTGTPLVNGMVDPQHPWLLWITRPDGKVEAYGYPPTDAGNDQLLADYRTAQQLGLPVQTRILPPETKPLSFDALRRLAAHRAQYTRAFRTRVFDAPGKLGEVWIRVIRNNHSEHPCFPSTQATQRFTPFQFVHRP